MRIHPELIKIFNVVVPEGEKLIPEFDVNYFACRAGYIVPPEGCTAGAMKSFESMAVNYNTTFYSSFGDVTDRTRLQLLLDQFFHYASTYGSDFSAPVFTQNPAPTAMAYKSLTVVKVVTARELYDMCLSLLNSGAALKPETVEVVCNFIAGASSDISDLPDLDISSIVNREARARLYGIKGVIPDNPEEFLRVVVYLCCGETMLINSGRLLRSIEQGAASSPLALGMMAKELPDETIHGLASIYFRYKHIFIAIKKGFRAAGSPDIYGMGAKLVNRLRRLAPKFKQPFDAPVLARVRDEKISIEDVKRAVRAQPSCFLLVRLLGYVRMQKSMGADAAEMYVIRNGTTFITESESSPMDPARAAALDEILLREIADRLSPKVKGLKVRYPENLELTAPTSEKNFVGNIPFLSRYTLGKDNFLGIYWRNEWGTRDFDLSAVFPGSHIKIGWNADYKLESNDVIFSGDMTNAEPEATEVLFLNDKAPEGFLFVNRYFGKEGSQFRLFLGQGKPVMGKEENTLPGSQVSTRIRDIRMEADIISTRREQMVGYINASEFRFLELSLGHRRVSDTIDELPLIQAMATRSLSAVYLRELLEAAGAIEAKPDETPDIDLDPRQLSKARLIDIFS